MSWQNLNGNVFSWCKVHSYWIRRIGKINQEFILPKGGCCSISDDLPCSFWLFIIDLQIETKYFNLNLYVCRDHDNLLVMENSPPVNMILRVMAIWYLWHDRRRVLELYTAYCCFSRSFCHQCISIYKYLSISSYHLFFRIIFNNLSKMGFIVVLGLPSGHLLTSDFYGSMDIYNMVPYSLCHSDSASVSL